VVKPLDRIGEAERAVIDERARTGYAVERLEHFETNRTVLRMLLEHLLPGVPATIDLAGFVDAHTGRPMGRGDRREGLPPEPELFAAGLTALADAGFGEMAKEDQRDLIGRMRRGEADDGLGVPAKDFVDRLLDKALAGYLAHPDTWIRIGFTGPAYPEGYAWIGPAEAIARHDRKPGWERL
jgi:hypothetical protein